MLNHYKLAYLIWIKHLKNFTKKKEDILTLKRKIALIGHSLFLLKLNLIFQKQILNMDICQFRNLEKILLKLEYIEYFQKIMK